MANESRGRRKKSLAELKQSKNYRPDRNGFGPVKMGKEPPIKPRAWKNRKASNYWDSVVPKLYEAGVVTEVDTAELTALCEWYSRWRHAEENPTSKAIDVKRCYDTFAGISKRFGLTPLDRQRLTEHEEPKASPIDDFLNKRLNKVAEG